MKTPCRVWCSLVLTVILVCFGTIRIGGAEELSTTYVGGNGNDGEMFDVLALKNIEITGLRMAFFTNTVSDTVDVFQKAGSYVGSEAIPGNWTAAATSLVGATALVPTPIIPFAAPIPVGSGERVALYIRATATDVAYTNGVGSGTVAALDPNLVVFEGIGVAGSFGAISQNRISNVTIVYDFQAGNPPEVKIIGPRRITTSAPVVRVAGLATDDGKAVSVRVRFKVARANGSLRNVTRTRTPDPATGLFQVGVRTLIGRNPVRITAVDNKEQVSAVQKVIITGVVL